jgi:hypothetical protein
LVVPCCVLGFWCILAPVITFEILLAVAVDAHASSLTYAYIFIPLYFFTLVALIGVTLYAIILYQDAAWSWVIIEDPILGQRQALLVDKV